jgi:hypothetical protein
MPNGAYNPQCANCDSFRYRKNRRCCRKHNFIMPELSELICTDYTHSKTATSFTDGLNTGELYYYSYASSEQPQSLGSFIELQTPIFQVQIRPDAELGWLIYTHPDDPFPDSNQIFSLIIEQNEIPFQAIYAERTLATGGTRFADNTWKTSYTTSTHRLLTPINKPFLLHDWLDDIFDLEANDSFIRNHEMSEFLKDSGIFALVRIVTPLGKYELIPDFIQHLTTFRRESNA